MSKQQHVASQSIAELRRNLEQQSAEYFKQVELLKLSHQREMGTMAQAVASSSGGCHNCPILLKKIDELNAELVGLRTHIMSLSREAESHRQGQQECLILRERLETSEDSLMRLKVHMSDLKRSHSEKSAELDHRLVQARSGRDDLLA